MNPQSAASTYLEESLESAPPIKIVRLLYQGAIRFMERAGLCEASDPESQFVYWVSRAEDIVIELRCSLDANNAPEVVASLEQLYLFVEDLMQQAVRERSTDPLVPAQRVMKTLLDAWTQVGGDAPSEA